MTIVNTNFRGAMRNITKEQSKRKSNQI